MKAFEKHTKRLTRILGLAVFLFLAGCVEDTLNEDDRTQWLGAWTVTESTGINAPQSYTITIYSGTTLDVVEMSGLYNQGSSFYLTANVYGGTMTIPSQTVDGITISGSGSISASGTTGSLEFVANDGTGNDEVIASMKK